MGIPWETQLQERRNPSCGAQSFQMASLWGKRGKGKGKGDINEGFPGGSQSGRCRDWIYVDNVLIFPISRVYLVIYVLNPYFLCPKRMLAWMIIVSRYKCILTKPLIHTAGIRISTFDLIPVSPLPGRLTELLGTCFPGHKSHGKRADNGVNWDLFPLAESQDSGIRKCLLHGAGA